MRAEEEASLIEKGRERGTATLRSKVHWALVSMVIAGAVPGLLFADTPAKIWVTLAVVIVAAVAAVWVADFLVRPVLVLKRRLEVKNYGDQAMEDVEDSAKLGEGGFELAAWMLSVGPKRDADLQVGLPVELAAIERLARAGRVSEIAMESVRRDLFRHLSHQLKSPLASIKALSQSARAGAEVGDIQGVTKSLATVEAIGQSMAGLVEQMLAMAWVEGLEEQGLSGRKANLSEAIMDLVGFRERAAADKQMRLEASVEAGLWVKGQQQLLQEMVVSLVDNSIRYAPAGTSIVIEARRLPSTRTVVVSVTDRGPGIPVQERERVFEPFYGSIGLDARGIMTFGTRRHRALGAGVEKTSHGLGLALVRSVAKLHGAHVTLDSGPGGIGLCARIALTTAEPPTDEELARQATGM